MAAETNEPPGRAAGPGAPSTALLAALAAATPAERGEILLGWLERGAGADGSLPPGALLDGVDLSGPTLAARVAGEGRRPAWWDAGRRGIRLEGAGLGRVGFRGADLRRANLRRADLRGATFRGADLRRASLEEADLRDADLAGADLRGASLGEADLRGALLEDANLRGAGLRFARLGGATLEQADLRRADLWGAGLPDAAMIGADLRGAHLRDARFRGADLRRADLRGALVDGADLAGSDLAEARLQGVDLSRANLANVRLGGAWLEQTRLRKDQLGGAIGEELNRDHESAARGYLALEQNFAGLGDTDAMSWAYRKKRRMQKRDARARGRRALARREPAAAAEAYAEFAGDQFVEWVCDYGESVGRVLASLLLVYSAFTLLYGATGSVMRVVDTPSGPARVPTGHPIDLATFSLLAMSTSGSPAVGLVPSTEAVHLLTATLAFVGIALTGLLGFVIGNRIRR